MLWYRLINKCDRLLRETSSLCAMASGTSTTVSAEPCTVVRCLGYVRSERTGVAQKKVADWSVSDDYSGFHHCTEFSHSTPFSLVLLAISCLLHPMQISALIWPQCQMDVPVVVSADISPRPPESADGCCPRLLPSLRKLMAEHFGVCTVEKFGFFSCVAMYFVCLNP